MGSMSQATRGTPAAAVTAAFVGWSIFLPIGVKYPLLLGATAWGLWQLRRQGGFSHVKAEPAMRLAVLFWAWSAVSALWTAGPWQEAAGQVGLYALVLCVPVIGQTLPAGWALRAMQHFCVAAGAVGGLCLLQSWALLPAPDAWVWHSAVTPEGNQRIVTSLLLALGCALALREAIQVRLQGRGGMAAWGWCAVACAAAAGLASQDRRTGMVTLPVLVLILGMGLALAQRAGRRQRVGLALTALLCCLAVGVGTPGVRDRFAEGFKELASYSATGDVANSWGMRLRMVEKSVEMATERPIAGHGLGSWATLWTQRVPAHSLLADQRTPHNEYLLVLTQTGLVGLVLWLGVLWAHATRGLWRSGARVVPASLLVWGALAWAGFFNVVLRDGKFAVPLLMLAALAWAGARPLAVEAEGARISPLP